MISRVTHQTIQRSTLANLQINLSKMAQLQAQMSTGKKITKPSDNPAGAADLLAMRAEQSKQDMQARNISDADGWLTTADAALRDSITALTSARNLTIQARDGALGQQSREAIAANLEGVRDHLLALANSTYLGRSVFAGTAATEAFDQNGNFLGWTGDEVTREITDGVSVRIDVNGAAAFGDGPNGDDSVFSTIQGIIDTLRGGDMPDFTTIAALDTHTEAMTTEVSAMGARHAQVLSQKDAIVGQQNNLRERISTVEDIDLAEILVELQMQDVAYQGALGAAAKMLAPTLMDYLR